MWQPELQQKDPNAADTAIQAFKVAIAINGVTFICEVLLFTFFLLKQMSLPHVVLFHFLIITCLITWFIKQLKAGVDLRFSSLTLFLTAFLGPIGATASLVSVIVIFKYRNKVRSFEDWYDALFPEHESMENQDLMELIEDSKKNKDKQQGVVPFVDVMIRGTTNQKRRALSMMGQAFKPEFAEAIRIGLADRENAIRVQTANIMALIESQFFQKTMELKALEEEDPAAPATLIKLAHHFDDYAFSGLLDADREDSNRQEAYKYYDLYLKTNPEDESVYLRLGRLLIREKNYEKAASSLKIAIDQGSNNPKIYLWYVECLYFLKDYQELRKFCEEHKSILLNKTLFPPKIIQTIELWAQ